MQEYLYKYLVLNRKLSIPQLGNLVITNEPAFQDVAIEQIVAPKPVIRFTEARVPIADKSFFVFLSEEMGVEEVTAIRAFHEFSTGLLEKIEEHKPTCLTGIGIFTKTEEGILSFVAVEDVLTLLPPVHYDNAIMEIIDGTESRKDYWWFYAIILGILGAGALLYYYA